MQILQQLLRVTLHGLLGRDAIHVDDARAEKRKADAPVGAEAKLIHRARHRRHQFGQARLQFGLRGLGVASGGHVRKGAKHPRCQSVRVALADLAAHVQPAPLATLVAHAQLAGKAVDLPATYLLAQALQCGPVVGVHQGLKTLDAVLYAVRGHAQHPGQMLVHAEALTGQAPVPHAQRAALQRQQIALAVFLKQRAVLLRTPKQQRKAQQSRQDDGAAHPAAPKALLIGTARGRQGAIAIQPDDDHQRVCLEPPPGVIAIHPVHRVGGAVLAVHRLGRSDEAPVLRHRLAQHVKLRMRDGQVAAVVTHQNGHVTAIAKQVVKALREVAGRHRQRQHASKAALQHDGVGQLHEPLPRHPAHQRPADEKPRLPALCLHTEILAVGHRHAFRLLAQAGIHDAPRRVRHPDLGDAVVRKGLARGALGQHKGAFGVALVGGCQRLGHVFQAGHQRADMGLRIG